MNSQSLSIQENTPHESACLAIRERLPAYVTLLVLGNQAQGGDPVVTTHIQGCASCRAELDELVLLTATAYSGQVQPVLAPPQADLSFLHQPASPLQLGNHPSWWLDEVGRLTVAFQPAIFHTPPPSTLAGAARGGQLIYRYVQEPQSVNDLEVTIEVFVDRAMPSLRRVRVIVDVPSMGPLDQAGSLVIMRANMQLWEGETDEAGCVDFPAIPPDLLPQLRIEVTPMPLKERLHMR